MFCGWSWSLISFRHLSHTLPFVMALFASLNWNVLTIWTKFASIGAIAFSYEYFTIWSYPSVLVSKCTVIIIIDNLQIVFDVRFSCGVAGRWAVLWPCNHNQLCPALTFSQRKTLQRLFPPELFFQGIEDHFMKYKVYSQCSTFMFSNYSKLFQKQM